MLEITHLFFSLLLKTLVMKGKDDVEGMSAGTRAQACGSEFMLLHLAVGMPASCP